MAAVGGDPEHAVPLRSAMDALEALATRVGSEGTDPSQTLAAAGFAQTDNEEMFVNAHSGIRSALTHKHRIMEGQTLLGTLAAAPKEERDRAAEVRKLYAEQHAAEIVARLNSGTAETPRCMWFHSAGFTVIHMPLRIQHPYSDEDLFVVADVPDPSKDLFQLAFKETARSGICDQFRASRHSMLTNISSMNEMSRGRNDFAARAGRRRVGGRDEEASSYDAIILSSREREAHRELSAAPFFVARFTHSDRFL